MKRILWLSDIHFNGENLDPKSVKLVDSFIRSIQELDYLDYLIITGDIAKSGNNDLHYEKFKEQLLTPFSNIFPGVPIYCIPGNHDVSWDRVKLQINSVVQGANSIDDFLNSYSRYIDKNYFNLIFPAYQEFHTSIASNKPSKTFSNYVVDGNIVFIFLNSAWLSIGAPTNEEKIEQKVINKTRSYELINEVSKKVVFHEIGNQTYGFILPNIAVEIERIGQEIDSKYPNHFKILVAHHPPNNWLSWRELYVEDAQNRSILDMICYDNQSLSIRW